VWALLPVKRFATGKSRLSAVLTSQQRHELTCHMLSDVLSALRQAACIDTIVILSDEPGIAPILWATAAGRGGERLSHVERRRERYQGDVNRSLTAAIAEMPASADRILIIPADVPAVAPADIEALSCAHERLARRGTPSVVLVPAVADRGTNAVLTSRPLAIELQFGARHSLARHLESARRTGAAAQVLARPGLTRDIDRPDDLDWFAGGAFTGDTAAYLRRMQVQRMECAAS